MRKDLIDEVINSPKVDAQLDKLDERLEKVVKKLVEINRLGKNINFGKGFAESTQAAQDARTATEELLKARAELARQEQLTRNAIAESRLEQQRSRTEIDKTREAEAKARAAKRATKEATTAEKGSIIDLRNTLKSLQAQYDALGPAARRAIGGKQMLAQIKATDAELKKLEASTGRFQRNVGNYPKFLGGLQGFLGGAGLGVTLGAAGVGMVGAQVFETTKRLDSLDAALKAVTESNEEYEASQRFLLETSERLGLNILDLTSSYKSFYAASTQSGLTADQTRSIFNSVAEVSAKMKLSQEDVNGVFTAFGQIVSKGKVQAEELRGQIGERIPGAFAIAARAIGVTQEKLNDMMKNGEVIANEFLPKFAAELEKTFGVEANEHIEGVTAAVNRLDNEFTKLVSNNQSGLSRFFTGIINFMREALNGFNIFLEKIQGIGDTKFGRWIMGDFIDVPDAEEKTNSARRAALREANKALVEEYRNATTEQRNAIMERRKLLAAAAQQDLDKEGKAAPGGIATSVNDLFDRAPGVGRLERLREAAFQELDVLRQIQEIEREEAAAHQNNVEKTTKAQEKSAAALRERQRKAMLDSLLIDKQTAIDSQKEIFENEKVSFQDRLDALANYYDLREELITSELDAAKNKEGLLPEEIVSLERKANADRLANKKTFWKEYTQITKSATDEETKLIIGASEAQARQLDEAEQKEIQQADEYYRTRRVTEEQHQLMILQIRNKYNVLRLREEIESAQKSLKVLKEKGLPTVKAEEDLNKLRRELADADRDYFEKTEKAKYDAAEDYKKKREKLEEEYAAKVVSLRQDAYNAVTEIGISFFDREKNRVQDEINVIEQQREREIELANKSTLTEEERANRITIINQTAQVRKEALERKQREIEARGAQFQKNMSLLQIAITTAADVFKIKSTAAVLASRPDTMALAPLALAQIPVVIGSGLLQAAAIAAKPIPKYRFGTSDHPGGLAEVGDGYRHEMIVNPDGTLQMTPAKPTYMDIPEHAKVFPSIPNFFDTYRHLLFPAPPPSAGGSQVSDKEMARQIVDGLKGELRAVRKSIESRPSERTTITEKGFQNQIYKNRTWTTYINRHVKGING